MNPADDDALRIPIEDDALRFATVLLDDQEVLVVPVDQGQGFLAGRGARALADRYDLDGEGLSTRTRDR